MAQQDVTMTAQEWVWAQGSLARAPGGDAPLLQMRAVALHAHLVNQLGDVEAMPASTPLTFVLHDWQRKMLAEALADPRNQWVTGVLARVWQMRRALGDVTAPTLEQAMEVAEENGND